MTGITGDLSLEIRGFVGNNYSCHVILGFSLKENLMHRAGEVIKCSLALHESFKFMCSLFLPFF